MALVGGGGHATVVLDSARRSGTPVVGFYDDDAYAMIHESIPCLGTLRDFYDSSTPVHLALGDLAVREHLPDRFQGTFAEVRHPSAIVSTLAVIEEGAFVGAGAIVNTHSRIGKHCVVNSRAVIEHHCHVGANCHLAPGAILGGHVSVGANTLVGIGATVNPGIRIGEHSVVGAGSVVTRDLPSYSVAVGIPARIIGRCTSRAA